MDYPYVAVVLGAEQVGIWRGFYIFVGLLIVLQVLHLFWFYTIACMVYSFVATGGVEKDVREETESEAEEVTGEYSAKLEAADKLAAETAEAAEAKKTDKPKKALEVEKDQPSHDDADTEEDQPRDHDVKRRSKRASAAPAATVDARITRSKSRN